MPAPSKRVTDRIQRSHTVENAATRFAAVVTTGCVATFASVSEAGVVPADVGFLCRLAGRILARQRRQLQAADRALVEARQLRVAGRQQLDRAAVAVRCELVKLRRLLKIFLGAEEAVRLLGLVGPTPREASTLGAAARAAGERLSAAESQPRQQPEGVKLEYATLAARLRPLAASLASALGDLEVRRWQERRALDAQRDALATFDRVYGDVARFLEASLELAGHDDLARRVRPGVGRRGRPPASASSEAIPSSDNIVESWRTRLRKARALFAGGWQIWQKVDTSAVSAEDAIRKEKMFPASSQGEMKKTSRPWRQRFFPRKSGSGVDERRAA